MGKILSNTELENLSKDTQRELLFLLYKIEDELNYNNKQITNTIDFLQKIL